MLEQRTEVESIFTSLGAIAPALEIACESTEHWVAITTSAFNIHTMRGAFRAQSVSNNKAPIIVSAETLPLYLKANPVIAEQLAYLSATNCVQKTAHFALRLLHASPILTSATYEDEWISAEKQLTALAAAFNLTTTHPQQQVAQIFDAINAWNEPVSAETHRADAPACLPELQAVYEELDSAILVLPHNAAPIIAKTDWQAVAKHFSDRFSRLQITTTTHLKLLAHQQLAIGFSINRFRHEWGADLLAESPITDSDVVRSALQFILSVSCEDLPHLYFTLPDHELGTLIHDIQNQLLKVQLQSDLLCLLRGLPRPPVASLVSTRNMTITARIDAIRDHIDQWIAYYHDLLKTMA